MKKLLTIVAASVALAATAADTDVGALITASNIEDVAAVENLTGANAGKATVTIKNNSGTANAVTVYNSATMDTALSGKASTGDVTALQTRATALETATNNLTTALKSHTTASNNPHNVTAAQVGALTESQTYNAIMSRIIQPNEDVPDNSYAISLAKLYEFEFLTTEEDPTVPSWAKESSKPSYNFSEIGSRPTTLGGYGITDAKIANGTITLGANSITPLTTYTESDPVFTAAKAAMDAATAAKVPLANVKVGGTALTASTVVELGQYYVKTVDGKPHLFLRGN